MPSSIGGARLISVHPFVCFAKTVCPITLIWVNPLPASWLVTFSGFSVSMNASMSVTGTHAANVGGRPYCVTNSPIGFVRSNPLAPPREFSTICEICGMPSRPPRKSASAISSS